VQGKSEKRKRKIEKKGKQNEKWDKMKRNSIPITGL
jgi:hypothetical protein